MATLASVIQRGLHSALPSAGIAGRLYFCSDSSGTYQGTIFYDDGTSWDGPYGGSGGGGGPAFQVNGTPLTSATTVNFVNGTNVTITNPTAGEVEIAASGGGPYTPPLLSGFTAVNTPSGATSSDSSTGLAMNYPTGITPRNMYLLNDSTAYPGSGTFRITVGVDMSSALGPSNFEGVGVCIGDTTGKFVWFAMICDGSPEFKLVVDYFTNPTNYSSEPETLAQVRQNVRFLQIYDDGTNFNFFFGADVNSMISTGFTLARGAFIGTPTTVGIGILGYSNYVGATYFDYVRGT